MIDLSKLTNEELIQLRSDVSHYISNINLKEPDFFLNESSIKVESTSTVNPDTLTPTLEIKISVNMENMQHFRVLWEQYYKKEYEFYDNTRALPPEKRTTLDIRNAIETSLHKYLDEIYPVVHYI